MRPARPPILAIDDDPFVLEMIQLHLWDYDVRTARSGDEALAILSYARPVLILLDVNMPGMDGIETLIQIRKRSQLAGALVLMLTAKADRATISKALAEGSDGYMLKPFTSGNLTVRVRQMLRKTERNIIEL
ncbi:response regulator [Phenylobacterium sp.]|uniref:response regulator n=1 Tax=Phenylobacterium sp. TaxID=1871053 RepID=UPI002722C04C|nr:response regulator [Phenylobacterium sp.]MDO8801080.1 response regulator [Phenylobacterium sp.]